MAATSAVYSDKGQLPLTQAPPRLRGSFFVSERLNIFVNL